jgi:hypothetical protein
MTQFCGVHDCESVVCDADNRKKATINKSGMQQCNLSLLIALVQFVNFTIVS